MQTLVDASSQHRLILEYVTNATPPLENGGYGMDFHALHLETLCGETWRNDLTISRDDFQAGFDEIRWIAKIHSFNPHDRIAILQTAIEESKSGIGVVEYCWSEWDLARNCLARQIKICDNPFDPLDE